MKTPHKYTLIFLMTLFANTLHSSLQPFGKDNSTKSVQYTVQSKETVVSIARKFNINEYIIRDKNNLYNAFGFLKKGSTLLLPEMHCKKAFIYIGKQTYLPVSINIYDAKGLLESYDFFNVEKNIVFQENEFSKHYKDYNF